GGSGWAPTTVPGVLDASLGASAFRGTVGWYRVTFEGPRAPAGFRWALRFDDVRRVATAWLNGRRIGTHDMPYAPFELPATGLRPGRPNTLVVRVDGRKGAEPREGWWNWGGITGPVALVPEGRVALSDPGLLYLGGGRERFDGWVSNRSSRATSAAVEVTLRAPDGTPTSVRRGLGALAPGERRRVRFDFAVRRPDLWQPRRPRLYDATVEALAGDAVGDVRRMRVGLRTVTVRDGLLYVNGRRVDLRGASVIPDVPGRGPALRDSDVAAIVGRLQALHANVTRSHLLLDQRLLSALDAAGIMVWQQAPVYHRDRLLETPAQRAAALAEVRATVLGSRDHPSVITHSVANELSVVPDRTPGTRAFLDAARERTADLDPSVPPSVDLLSYPGYPRQATYARFPLLGINAYFGWYAGKRGHSTARLADLGPYLERMRRIYPSALVLTEFGAEATERGPASEKQTYAFQAGYVRRVLDVVGSEPFMSGAIYWTLQEYAVKPDWDGGAAAAAGWPLDSIHHKGLIAYADGLHKPAWAVAAAMFAGTPLYPRTSPPAGDHAGRLARGLPIAVPAAIVALLLASLWATAGIWRLTRPTA
ncbi:MAG TPA: glycoside hydrolase family 2 TIM barrel-domain containing protein, partial [Solirubrobacteraceae bacterium]|nr:glycoside hydrolase family 2 TIM barrel-domain containing protein [Solirubrobacteraceae bacterium]